MSSDVDGSMTQFCGSIDRLGLELFQLLFLFTFSVGSYIILTSESKKCLNNYIPCLKASIINVIVTIRL